MNRFYVGESKSRFGSLELNERLWLNDKELAWQILRVLRMRPGEHVVLFDGKGLERMYKIDEIEESSLHLVHVTDLEPRLPSKKITLAFSMLKKDKNEWVLQKCTELGVTHFLPTISERTEKTGFDADRAHKIVIEASEQCGRHDIPVINDPQTLQEIVGKYREHQTIFVADMGNEVPTSPIPDQCIVFVGPEGGWSDNERRVFEEAGVQHIGLGEFTLRAETACVTACHVLSNA